ncbi:MAG: SGNH/GDSL hydrolase family protein [Gemmatimonadaceae bacterium]
MTATSRFKRISGWAVAIGLSACAPAISALSRPQAAVVPATPGNDIWERDIAAFEAEDRVSPPRQRGVLFVGSSSIRVWSTLDADFPGIDIVQRGFGGSELGDVVRYAPRIVIPYHPRLIVLYAGDNDLAAGKSPTMVFDQYRSFVELVQRELPSTRMAFVSIKPSGSRLALMPQIREANDMIRRYAARDARLAYVDVFTPMLGPDGRPREELFLPDRLHMNAAGYAIWKSILDRIVRDTSHDTPAMR